MAYEVEPVFASSWDILSGCGYGGHMRHGLNS